jgi:hypothetical protein
MEITLSDPKFQIGKYLQEVDAVVAYGGTTSERFDKLRAGWTAATTGPTKEDLEAAAFEAISAGDPDAVEATLLRATTATLSRAHVQSRLARTVLLALRDAYTDTAGDNYGVIAKRYDAAAAKFAECAATVDVGMDAEAMVSRSAKERGAWSDAGVHAAELDSLLPVMVAAAALTGIRVADRDGATLTGTIIGLTCDPGTAAHCRRVWEAWKSARSYRCGRWGALLALGVKLRAADLSTFEPYREPRPLEHRQERSGGSLGGVRQFTVDPEDADYKPASPTDTPQGQREAKDNARRAKAWSKVGRKADNANA